MTPLKASKETATVLAVVGATVLTELLGRPELSDDERAALMPALAALGSLRGRVKL